jgi:DNA-binding CsgD family transcriptional regulator
MNLTDVSDLVFTGQLRKGEEERAILEKAFSDLADGATRMIAITGDPGTGKTRMLAQAAAIGRSRGVPVFSGSIPFPSENVPLAVLADAFNDYISSVGDEFSNAIPAHNMEALASASPLFPYRDAYGAGPRASGRFGCFRAVHALIETLASHGPIAITLDDLERADPETIDVVRLLMSFPPRAAVLLVLAYRDRQASPVLRSAAETASGLTRLPIMPLTEAQVGEWLGAEVSQARRKALHRASGGNPAYLGELLEAPSPPGGADPEDAPVSRRFTTIIAAETSILSRVALLVVSGAAVVGDDFTPAVVQTVADVCEAHLYPALDELAGRDLVRPVPATGDFCFRHPLVRRAIYQATSPGWRLAAHARAADLLAASSASPVALAPHLARVAGRGDTAAADVLAAAASVVECDFPAAAARWRSAALRLRPDGKTPDDRRQALASGPGKTQAATGQPQPPEVGVRALTWRERQVAELVSEGLTNRAIARRLSITEKTVEAHLSKVFSKLGAPNRVSVARMLLHDVA